VDSNKERMLHYIVDYLMGRLSPAEAEFLRKWLNEDPANMAYFRQIEKIWKCLTPRESDWDVESEKRKLFEKLGIDNGSPEAEKRGFRSFALYRRKRTDRMAGIMRIAAIIIIFFGISFLFRSYQSTVQEGQESSKMNTLRVSPGQITQIILKDGTKITLDAGSMLRYPENFPSDRREVELVGEAFFEVSSDKKRPFVVRLNRGAVKVLGTKFNVRAWPETRKVLVAVLEGRVRFMGNRPDRSVVVKDGYRSVLEKAYPSPPEKANVRRYLSWMRREYYFERAPVREVLNQLSRWYLIDFVLPDSSYRDYEVTFFVRKEPLSKIVQKLALIMDLDFRMEDGKVFLIERKSKGAAGAL